MTKIRYGLKLAMEEMRQIREIRGDYVITLDYEDMFANIK